ncbi:GNAT family N-acetyltransferase [Thalassospira sp.]|uniref:GNAT family N-acetyltransferase n=1 Tax=Thalassospira sp. TaxID=1912094 RepID=UPI0027341E55|nr:GNAT family N-acetyltransferase [Thalassospira sp.]MDP2699875.1 N-acetyltransferase family protein [Thalassospira sp.]
MTHISPSLATAILLRDARPDDMPKITAIYAHHVQSGTASFEETAPDIAEMANRHAAILDKDLPWLVAEYRGDIVGYCYAALYRPRSGYRHTLENSVYIADGMAGNGIGSLLMESLIARCEAGPWRQMIAAIGDSNNAASLALHRKFGFEPVGTLRHVGFKFGTWLDSVLMQRGLGTEKPPIALAAMDG